MKYRTECKNSIFLSLGRSIDLKKDLIRIIITNNDQFNFITSTSDKQIDAQNVFYIPADEYQVQNNIACADIYLGKPGWGSISECYCNDTPMVLIDYDYNVEWKKIAHLYKTIDKRTQIINYNEFKNIHLRSYIDNLMKKDKTRYTSIRKKREKCRENVSKVVDLLYNIK